MGAHRTISPPRGALWSFGVLSSALWMLAGCGAAGKTEESGSFIDFSSHALGLNLLFFTLAGGVVWFAGMRLSEYVSELAERTGAGKAFLGALLLGGVTSLPEVATTVTSALAGEPVLAVNNIFGSIAMNVLLLAVVADVVDGGRALTAQVRQSTLILQGTLSILVIAVAAAAVLLAEYAVLGVGIGSMIILVVGVTAFYLTHRFRTVQRWLPAGSEGPPSPSASTGEGGKEEKNSGKRKAEERRQHARGLSMPRLLLYTLGVSCAILVAGFLLSRTGSAIAKQTGIGESLIGFILIAFATSLPEISTMISAVRLGEFSLVFSEIFGTNIFDSMIIFFTDAAYRSGPLLEEVGVFSQFAALLGIVLTAVYVSGLVTRSENTSIAHLGKDSLAVIALYAIGVVVLYMLR